jgi:hypothetical protein
VRLQVRFVKVFGSSREESWDGNRPQFDVDIIARGSRGERRIVWEAEEKRAGRRAAKVFKGRPA